MNARDGSDGQFQTSTRRRIAPTEAPVFVVGSPRSGTTLLYHMLLGSGAFAYYRWETRVYDVLAPLFGDLKKRKSRERLMAAWLDSPFFRLSGLDAAQLQEEVVNSCRDWGDFLQTVMGGIARRQGVRRWADCTPSHLRYMEEIKKEIPTALFVHIIRDGRDVALSLDKLGWMRPFPWDSTRSLLVTGIWWEWLVSRGLAAGRRLQGDYFEVRFEDLVARPRETLQGVGSFIGEDLDYDRIREAGIGSVAKPNTSFVEEGHAAFNPVGRWKSKLDPGRLIELERTIGPMLKGLGYELSSPLAQRRPDLHARMMRARYLAYFTTRHWVKHHTPLPRYLGDRNLERP